MTDVPFDKLGPYEIKCVVGRGGMGTVYSAVQLETGENAAVKVLSPALASDSTFRERFIAEIASLETLNHPHIVNLHGFGEADGHLYYAMELVNGTNLEQELAAGRRFSWRDVASIGIDVSQALKHAHDHGVIHRDLKPANLLVNENDEVKLSDFGIAKLFGATRVTMNDSVMGTADYMSPEQAAGEATTPKCDLYSLGCVMYALLAGMPPFKGKSIAEVVHKVRYERHTPVSKLAPDIPADLEHIIDELLVKDPDERIRTALSLSHRLRSVIEKHSMPQSDTFSGADADGNDLSTAVPPADIAERPTVLIPGESAAETEQTPVRRPVKKTLNHFTPVEQKRITDAGRVGDHSSAVPLMFLLLTVLTGLIGGIWYSSLPLSADQLHQRIMKAAEDPTKLLAASDRVELFIKKFPDDNRIGGVRDLKSEIESNKLQRILESRARRRKETGKLSPVEVHCNDAFRAHREGDLETAIRTLKGIQHMFEAEADPDKGTQRVLELAGRLLPKWEKELEAEIEDLTYKLDEHHSLARSAMDDEDYEYSREIWMGTIELFEHRQWAKQYVDQAYEALNEIDRRMRKTENSEGG